MWIGRRAFVALATALALEALGGIGFAQPHVRRVAGETSPIGWPYSSFREAVVDAAGRVVFAASSSGIFARAGGIVQQIGAGDVVASGQHVAGVGIPALTADGCVVARATFTAGGEGIVRTCGSTPSVLLETGTAAPGGGAIRAFDPRIFVAGTDTVAAVATLEDGTSVLLRLDAGGLAEVARTGAPTPSGGTYAAFRLLGVTTSGMIGFRATVSDGPDGLFAATETLARAIAVVGQGSPVGGDFTSIGGGSLHPSGRLTFRAALSTRRSGVFAADTIGVVTILRAVALEGDPLPIEGATIRSFPSSIDPSIDGFGRVAFRALIAGATDPPRPSGVFVVWPDGAVGRIVTVRDVVAGVGTVSRLRDPLIADDGSVLVSAVIAGVGAGLFVARDGALAPLARLGDATDVDLGDSRFRFGAAAVTTSAEGAAFLGERDGIFGTDGAGAVTALAYTGQPSRLGGIMASLGPPVVDASGNVFLGVELQNALFNEVLMVARGAELETFVSPDRRLLGGGGIAEFFPTNVDALARPSSAASGVVFTAALQGAKTSEAVFLARSRRQARALVKVGQRASGQRITGLGTPAVGGRRNAVALLAEVGQEERRRAVVTTAGGVAAVAIEGGSTRSRAGGRFGEFGPPALGPHGALFRATIDGTSQEGLFVARGRRIGLIAGSGDLTTTGARLRSFTDPIARQDEVWFLARVAGSVAPAGLYRAIVPKIPGKADAPLAVEPILVPGDPAPSTLGGVIVRLDALRVGPGGSISVIADIGGGTTASAILEFGA